MKLNNYFKREWRLSLITIFCLFLLSCSTTSISFCFQELADIEQNFSAQRISHAFIYILGSLSIFAITIYLAHNFRRKLLRKICIQLKQDVFSALIKKDMNEFNAVNSAHYISVMNNDLYNIDTQYFAVIPNLLQSILTLLVNVVAICYFSPIVALVSVVSSVILLVVPKIFGDQLAKREKIVYANLEKYNSKLKDMLNGFELIKSFQATPHVQRIFHEQAKQVEDARYRSRGIQIPYFGLLYAGTLIVICIQLGFAVFLSYHGMLRPNSLLCLSFLVSEINSNLKDTAEYILSIRSTEANVKKVEDILNSAPGKNNTYSKIDLMKEISVKDMSFSYDGSHEVIKNISYDFKAGKKYALVGGSGSGKSTFLKVLSKSYDGYTGSIEYDHTQLASISRDSILDQLSIIQQKVFLFEDSLKNNITMYQDYSEDAILEVVEKTGIKDFLTNKRSDLSLVISEDGKNLSGGEQQRIAIARALLRKTNILMLDEATSSLDRKLADQIDQLVVSQKDLTVFNITHSLNKNILEKYDEILVMNHGTIAEAGTFDDLYQKGGLFYSLYTLNNI